VEYTFKNSQSEKVHTVILKPYHLVVQSAGNEEVIPYASITAVRLAKVNSNHFRTTLSSDDHTSVTITNKYYLPDGQVEDRSRQYTSFIRVLHYHLKDKGSPVYTSGFSLNLLTAWLLISAFTAFFISFISEYLGVSIINPFAQGLILTLIIAITVVVAYRGRLPKTYSPGEIPFQFLP
jgi:hypothetical protein